MKSVYEQPIPFKSVPDEPQALHYQQPCSSAEQVTQERHFDGPSLEEWTKAGYDPTRYPGRDAFMRVRPAQPQQMPQHVEEPVEDAEPEIVK